MEINNVKFLLNPFFFCDLQTDASSKAIFSKVMVITSKSLKVFIMSKNYSRTTLLSCFKNNLGEVYKKSVLQQLKSKGNHDKCDAAICF